MQADYRPTAFDPVRCRPDGAIDGIPDFRFKTGHIEGSFDVFHIPGPGIKPIDVDSVEDAMDEEILRIRRR